MLVAYSMYLIMWSCVPISFIESNSSDIEKPGLVVISNLTAEILLSLPSSPYLCILPSQTTP